MKSLPWHHRLEARVLLGVTLVVGVSLLAVLSFTRRTVTQASLDRANQDLLAAREAFNRLAEGRTQSAARQARLIAELPTFRTLLQNSAARSDAPTINQMANDYCRKLDADFCVVSDSQGAWIGSANFALDERPSTLGALVDAARRGRAGADVVTLPTGLFLVVAEPAAFDEREVLGSLAVGYRLDNAAAAELALVAHCDVTFLCEDGNLCGSSLPLRPRAALEASVRTRTPPFGSLDSEPKLHRMGDTSYVGGVYPLGVAGAHIGGPPANDPAAGPRLVLLQDWTQTERAIARIHRALLWVGFATFAIALGGGLVVSRRMTRPLRDLAGAANDLAGGNWERRVPLEGPAEGRIMAEAFNRMTVALRQREEQLRQAQKMEAVGRLAGGVAHDFNNLLTAILGYADLVLHDVPPDSPLRKDVEEIQKAGRSAAGLIRELLAFSRKQVLQPVVLDMNAILAETENLLRRLIGEHIELTLELEPALRCVRADRSQLEQVVINLAVNARDAMPNGGRLTIRSSIAVLEAFVSEPGAQPVSGPHAVLTVVDTGHGMSEEIRSRIFEPFFTTKPVGKGTGLGLATVYGIVKQSGGQLWVDSELGRGTSFNVALPVTDEDAPAAPAESVPVPAHGSELVLLVEDNDSVRALARETLMRSGYRVLEARNGQEALALSGGRLQELSLLVTDVVMPIMGGRELAARLTQWRPGLKVIFTSGHTDERIARPTDADWGGLFLQKPFTPATLGRAVRDVLDGAHAVSQRA